MSCNCRVREPNAAWLLRVESLERRISELEARMERVDDSEARRQREADEQALQFQADSLLGEPL
jgi:hypothetical protein